MLLSAETLSLERMAFFISHGYSASSETLRENIIFIFIHRYTHEKFLCVCFMYKYVNICVFVYLLFWTLLLVSFHGPPRKSENVSFHRKCYCLSYFFNDPFDSVSMDVYSYMLEIWLLFFNNIVLRCFFPNYSFMFPPVVYIVSNVSLFLPSKCFELGP